MYSGGRAAAGAPKENEDYAADLIERAHSLQLDRSGEWTALLHLAPAPWRSGRESEADGPDFFLAANGKQDPAAELAATLRAFFEPAIVEIVPEAEPGESRGNRGLQHPQCRFPARYFFLKSALAFDPARLPEQPCPRFEEWRSRIDPGAATLAFAAAYVSHPASAFGHTFLRLDKRSALDQPLLGYVVNFSAVATTGNAFLYGLAGLTGQFQGFFSLLPYYLKVKEYGDLEARDLWDYRINLTQPELDQLLRHVWELGTTWFDYWFLDENCAYHMLSLVEVARPDLRLRAHFPLWVVPIDTLRVLSEVPGLLGAHTRRPSLTTRMKARRDALSADERKLAVRLAEGEEAPEVKQLPLDRQALTVDTALDLLQYRLGDAAGDEQLAASKERKLAFARGRIGVATPDPAMPQTTPPDRGHKSGLFMLGGGSHGGAPFASLLYRGVLHDLVSASEGQMQNQQLEMGRFDLRYSTETHNFSLYELRLLRIESLDPVDGWAPKLAWRVTTGFERERQDGRNLRYWELRGGPGASLMPFNQLVYALAEVEAAASPDFDHDLRARLRPTLGVVIRPLDFFHLRLEASEIWAVADGSRLRPLLVAEQAFNLGRAQLRTNFSWSRDDWSLQSQLGILF